MTEDSPRTSKRRGWSLISVVLFATFLALFAWSYLKPTANTNNVRTTTVSGLYEQYAFIITTTSARNEKVANFNPTLPQDDEKVIAALREVMRTAYRGKVPDNVLPLVEEIDEKNYVTFNFDGYKTYFQLFKNAKGELGSVSFWRDSTEKY